MQLPHVHIILLYIHIYIASYTYIATNIHTQLHLQLQLLTYHYKATTTTTIETVFINQVKSRSCSNKQVTWKTVTSWKNSTELLVAGKLAKG